MPALVAAGDYAFGRWWERAGVLKPPEGRRRILAIEHFIRDDKTRLAVFRWEICWNQRFEWFLVLCQVSQLAFARQGDTNGSPELAFRVRERSPLLLGERVRSECRMVDQL